VPELAVQIRAQKSHEDELMVVLRSFGDEGHPQPEERGALMPLLWGLDEPKEDVAARMDQSPSWGRLPRLEDVEPAKHEVKGEPGTCSPTRSTARGPRSTPSQPQAKPMLPPF
jgi:hypothetical protein